MEYYVTLGEGVETDSVHQLQLDSINGVDRSETTKAMESINKKQQDQWSREIRNNNINGVDRSETTSARQSIDQKQQHQ